LKWSILLPGLFVSTGDNPDPREKGVLVQLTKKKEVALLQKRRRPGLPGVKKRIKGQELGDRENNSCIRVIAESRGLQRQAS